MLIVREVQGYVNFGLDEDVSSVYYIMDVNWLKERIWIVEKYEGRDAFGNHKIVHRQQSWDGVKGVLKGLETKKQTLQDIVDEVEGNKRDVNDFLFYFSEQKVDSSRYKTVRWFPFFKDKWTNGDPFIRDFKGHDIVEDYPEYFI